MLPEGKRVDDPPPKNNLRWRLALAAHKYPVQLALLLATLVLAVPVFLLISSNSDLRTSNVELKSSNNRLTVATARVDAALTEIQANRQVTVGTFCSVINENAVANNRQTDYLIHLLVDGAKQSGVFEKLYKDFGAPPLKERIQEAVKRGDALAQFRVQSLNCDAFVDCVNNEIQAKNTGKKPDPGNCTAKKLTRKPPG
jgi:hypothetical protein